MTKIELLKARLQAWEDELETNECQMQKYAARAIQLLKREIEDWSAAMNKV